MSNGIGKNPLNDISKVYLTQVAEKKDDSYLEPDMKKRQKNNEKARKDMEKMGTSMKNPHFEENQQGWDSINSLTDAFKAMQEEGYGAPGHNPGSGEKSVARAKALMDKKGQKGAPGLDAMRAANKEHEARRGVKKEELELDENRRAARAAGGYKDDSKKQNDPSKAGFTGVGNMSIDQIRKMSARMDKEKTQKEGLDPVGKEDGDVNNDGKKNKTDKYLMNRRKAIGSAIKNKMSSMKKEETEAAEYIETVAKVKEAERQNDIKRWVQKESRSSNWRNDLSEVMTDDIDSKPIKEKNIKNKIKINPKLGEAIEEIGGTILEEIEVDEIDVIVESVYAELIEEGFAEDEVEFGIETALNTLDEGYYDSAVAASEKNTSSNSKTPKMSMKDRLKSAAKKVISGTARAVGGAMKAKATAVAAPSNAKKKVMSYVDRAKQIAKKSYQQGRGPVEKKTTYRGAGAGRKEKIGEAVYGGTPEKKKDDRMVVTNADKKANTPAYQAYKAGNKKYKSADHMNEGDGDPCWDSHKQVGMKKKGGKMVPNCVPKNEEVDHVEEKFSMAADPEKRAIPRATRKAENKKGMSARSRAVKAVGTQRRQDKETGISGEKNPRAYREETEVEEGYKELSRDKRNTMFRKAGNLSRTALQGGDKGTEAGKKSGKIVKALNKDAEKYNRNDVKEDSSMSPQEIQLQKKKAMLDRMIAQRRQQGLNKTKKSEAPTKAMGEGMECDHSMKGKECPIHGKKDCSSMKEETEDSLRDRRMERGGVDGNNRYDRATKNVAMGGGKKKPYDGMSALEKVKASIRAKHGQGAIMDTKKK